MTNDAPRDVSCEVAERWLSRAIDEEITAEEEAILERHLDTCPRCRTERERLRMEVQRLESGFAGITAEIDDLLRGRLGADRIAAPRRSGRPGVSGLRLVGAVTALAAVIVAAVLSLDRSAARPAGPAVAIEWSAPGLRILEGGATRSAEGAGSGLLPVGARARVPAGGDLALEFPGGDRSRVGGEAEIVLRELGARTELELFAGRAAFEVVPRGGASFAVLTPHARIAVVGTRFGVIHEGGRTEVSVEEGVVAVTRRYREGSPVRIGPGGWLEISWRGMVLDSGGWQDPDASTGVPPPPAAGSGSGSGAGGGATAPAGGGGAGSEGPPRSRPLDVPTGGG